MPRGWRFNGRWAGWPTRCGRADPQTVADVTEAFVDRAPIDWSTLLARLRASRNRSTVESLLELDLLRRALGSARGSETPRPPHNLVRGVCVIVALAGIQTIGCLAVLALAYMDGVAPPDRNFQVVLAAAFGAASAMLAGSASRDARSLFLLAAFLSAASAFARGALNALPDARSAAIETIVRGLCPEAFTPACMWQFALHFPRVRRFTWFDTLARRATVAAWCTGLLLFGANAAAAYGLFDGTATRELRDEPSGIFWRVFTLTLVPAIAVILARSRRAPAEERRKVARFGLALAAGGAPFLIFGIVRTAMPSVDAWLLTASPADRLWIDRLVVAALTAAPVLTTMAVIVDRPFDAPMRMVARPAALASRAMAVAAFGPVILAAFVLYGARHAAIADVVSGSQGAMLLACVALSAAMLLLRPALIGALERRQQGTGDADHQEKLAVALERVRAARGSRETLLALGRALRDGIGADSVRVLVRERAGVLVDPLGDAPPLAPESALVAILRECSGPVDLTSDGPFARLLPQADRDWVSASGASLAAPIRRRDGPIAAVMIFGPRRGGSPYDRRDRWIVTTTTAAAAVGDEAGFSLDLDRAPMSRRGLAWHLGESGVECRSCGVVGESGPPNCACPEPMPTLAALPRHLGGKFVIDRRIGTGGMAVVYLARDTVLNRDVALKTFPELDARATARLRDEARKMAALDHDALATIYGLEFWRDTPVLVVEYLPGGTLARRLAIGAIPRADALRMAIALARALAYMHARGVLHRDLKPSNIAFASTGTPKLLDFGLATFVGPVRSGSRTRVVRRRAVHRIAGTLAYLPPEAFRGAAPSPAFDLWALSTVLLEALGGDSSRASSWRRIRTRGPAMSPPFSTFFERALAPEPDRRFQSAEELLAALGVLAKTETDLGQ